MSKLEERESRRRASIVGNMIEKPTEKTPGLQRPRTAKGGRPGAEKADRSLGAAQLVRGYPEDRLCAAEKYQRACR